MSIEEVKQLMQEVGWGSLATTDGKKVGVRPMSGWAWMENELWCASDKASDKIAQLRMVPYAEYCFCNKEGQHARLAGPCTISYDNDEKLKLYQANPILKDHIEDPSSPDYVVIKLKPDRIRLMDMTDMTYKDIDPA